MPSATNAPLERRDPPLVLVDAVAQVEPISQQVAHLTDRFTHRNQLRGKTSLGFHLPALKCFNALLHSIESLIRTLDPFVCPLQLVADLT